MGTESTTVVDWPESELPTTESVPAHGACYVLRLYVAASAPRSGRAIRNIRRLCDDYLKGRCDLAVIDICQQPALARDAQLVAAPTLVKERPLPTRRFVGTMTNLDQIMIALGPLPSTPTGTPR